MTAKKCPKIKLHVKSCCFAHKISTFFAVLVDFVVVVLKVPIRVQNNETVAMFVAEKIMGGLKPFLVS